MRRCIRHMPALKKKKKKKNPFRRFKLAPKKHEKRPIDWWHVYIPITDTL